MTSVARNLSFTRAAEQLHLSQPAVSMQVKQLEAAVGLPLFGQIGKRIYLTEAGLGLGLLSLHTLDMELALKRLVILDICELPIQRNWYVMYRSGKRLSAVARRFCAFVLDESAGILHLPTL